MRDLTVANLDSVILDSINIGIVALDSSFGIIKANAKAYEILCVKKDIIRSLAEGSSINWDTLLREKLILKNELKIENIEYNFNGKKHLDINIFPAGKHDTIKTTGWIMTVTESQKPCAQAAAGHADLLIKDNTHCTTAGKLTAIGELTTRIIHEINNSIDGLKRFNKLALKSIDSKTLDEASRYMQICANAISHMEATTKRVLDFVKSSDRDDTLCDVHCLIDDALNITAGYLERKAITVEKNFTAAINPAPLQSLLNVFINLIKNAVDAMDRGGRLTINSYDIGTERFAIEFIDTGRGVDDSIARELFRPFVTKKHDGKGVGLGLAISNDIVRQLNGSIEIEKTEENGSIFRVVMRKVQVKK